MKKSVLLTLIERSPKIIGAVALLIIACRARPGDLPQIVTILTDSKIFCLTGWIVATVVIVVAAIVVWVYIKLKPK